jgi:hypothetical protein
VGGRRERAFFEWLLQRWSLVLRQLVDLREQLVFVWKQLVFMWEQFVVLQQFLLTGTRPLADR